MSPVELTDVRVEGEGGGGGAKSYDGEKAWSYINRSILSGLSLGLGGSNTFVII